MTPSQKKEEYPSIRLIDYKCKITDKQYQHPFKGFDHVIFILTSNYLHTMIKYVSKTQGL